jgi:hypothetical protein
VLDSFKVESFERVVALSSLAKGNAMPNGLNLSIKTEGSRPVLRLLVTDQGLVGKQAQLRVLRIAKVTRSSGVDKQDSLFSENFTVRSGEQVFSMPSTRADLFHYKGEQLHIRLQAEIEIDDGVIFDTEVSVDASPLCRLPVRSKLKQKGNDVHSPKDYFRFWKNLSAIPAGARAMVLWLCIIGLPVIAANALLGAHDQFVPESQAFFYDHTDSDGDSESPLFKALAGSSMLGAALWMAIRHQLKKYMRFEARWSGLPLLKRGVRIPPGSLISADARVEIEKALFRIVAYNREHGQYKAEEKDGNKTKTVIRDFTHDAGGIVLYQQQIMFLPAGKELADVLAGELDVTPLFDALHPPMRMGGTHGLSICFEAQLLHPDFVDHESELTDVRVETDDFFEQTGAV